MGVRETFKENLKFYRKQAGLTQERLSELCKLNINYIAEIERKNAKFPKPETIDLIAEALEILPSMLFDERGSPKNIRNTFHYIYGKDLEKELKNRIVKEIEEVCKLI